MLQNPEQNGACRQRDEGATDAEFHRAVAVDQRIHPTYNLSIPRNRMPDPLPVGPKQFATEPVQHTDAYLGASYLTDLFNRKPGIADDFSGCHRTPPAGTLLRPHGFKLKSSALAGHCLQARNTSCRTGPKQGILKGGGSEVEFYSPLGRWKSESFKESPWHFIDFDEAEPLEACAKL